MELTFSTPTEGVYKFYLTYILLNGQSTYFYIQVTVNWCPTTTVIGPTINYNRGATASIYNIISVLPTYNPECGTIIETLTLQGGGVYNSAIITYNPNTYSVSTFTNLYA